jgi:hypothetical protein
MLSMRTLTILLPLTIALSCGGSTRLAPDGGAPDSGSEGSSGSGGGIDSGSLDSGSSSGGGSASSSGGGSSGCTSVSDASTVDASTWGESPDGGPWSPVCPEVQPASGAACPADAQGVHCEYGSTWWSVACATIMYCEPHVGMWVNNNPSPSTCFPEPGPNCVSCPVNPLAAPGSCNSPGLSCYYGEGSNCRCGAQGSWGCYPPSGCPSTRPRIGAPCVTGPPGGCQYTCSDGVLCLAPGPTWQPFATNSNCSGG